VGRKLIRTCAPAGERVTQWSIGAVGASPGSHYMEDQMTDRTYRVTEIVGTSPTTIDAAIRNGLDRAAQTLRHLDWFEVTQIRGQLEGGEVAHFQVGMKVGFRLEDS
jgi:dodecin